MVCYDDRFIVKLAYESDGVVVSNDTYRDLQGERQEWKRFIEERLLMYSFVNDKYVRALGSRVPGGGGRLVLGRGELLRGGSSAGAAASHLGSFGGEGSGARWKGASGWARPGRGRSRSGCGGLWLLVPALGPWGPTALGADFREPGLPTAPRSPPLRAALRAPPAGPPGHSPPWGIHAGGQGRPAGRSITSYRGCSPSHCPWWGRGLASPREAPPCLPPAPQVHAPR